MLKELKEFEALYQAPPTALSSGLEPRFGVNSKKTNKSQPQIELSDTLVFSLQIFVAKDEEWKHEDTHRELQLQSQTHEELTFCLFSLKYFTGPLTRTSCSI